MTKEDKDRFCTNLLYNLKLWGESRQPGLLDRAISHYEKLVYENDDFKSRKQLPTWVSSDILFKLGRLHQMKAITLSERCPVTNEGNKTERGGANLSAAESMKSTDTHSCKSLQVLRLAQNGIFSWFVKKQAEQMLELKTPTENAWPQKCKDLGVNALAVQPRPSGRQELRVFTDTSALDINLTVIGEHFPYPYTKALLLNNEAWYNSPQPDEKGKCGRSKEDMIEYARDSAVASQWDDDGILHTLSQVLYCSDPKQLDPREPQRLEQGWSILKSILCKSRVKGAKPSEDFLKLEGHFKSKRYEFNIDRCDDVDTKALAIPGAG
jgi:hypothetical protein